MTHFADAVACDCAVNVAALLEVLVVAASVTLLSINDELSLLTAANDVVEL